MLYVATEATLYAFNATSESLLWSASGLFTSSPAVSNGAVYVGTNDNFIDAFDANGVTNCSGTPTVCSPLWTALTGPNGAVSASPAVANGIVYAGGDTGELYAFDADGVTNCSGPASDLQPPMNGDDDDRLHLVACGRQWDRLRRIGQALRL